MEQFENINGMNEQPLSTSQEQLLREVNANLVEIRKLLSKSYKRQPYTILADVNIPIGSMVVLMLKWLLASIPVGIIVGIAWGILSTLVFFLR